MDNDFLLEVLERTLDNYLRTDNLEHLINTLQFIIEDLKHDNLK
jgi:hypothetical protein